MRKRKSPIVLVTALVVIVTGVAGLNFAWSHTNGPASAPEAPPVENTSPVGQSRPGASAAEVAQGVKGAMASKGRAAESPEGGPSGPPNMGGGPMILNPARAASAKPEKPKPNTSSTSAQWYNDESAMSKDKG